MKFKSIITYILCFVFCFSNLVTVNAQTIAGSYTGTDNVVQTLNNIDFKDVTSMPNNYWAKNSIYKMAALSIIKGYGEKSFAPNNNVTKAEVIALIYRSLGKEADAQKEGKTLEDNRLVDEKKNNARDVWADGYLLLAQKDGLITQEQFDQATNVGYYIINPADKFDVNSAAKRQEVAEWLAKAFKIDPIYNQTSLFNNYADWKQIDLEKIPYVEALLVNKIMNGDNGHFYPNQSIKRDEIAQVLNNLEEYIYKINSLTKRVGYVESISTTTDNQVDKSVETKSILIRSNDGKLYNINLSKERNILNPTKQEIGKNNILKNINEIVVNKDGVLGNSDLLTKDDGVILIFDKDNKVKYIEAKRSNGDTRKYYGSVENIDQTNNILSFKDNSGKVYSFPISSDILISMNNEGKTIQDIAFGVKAYFHINHNVIIMIEVTNAKDQSEYTIIKNDATGIVREINPNLNYILLYSEDGKKDEKYSRTFNFTPSTKITKDGTKITSSEIEVGDTAYIKFDKKYNIELINIKNNYTSKYGEIVTLGQTHIVTKYEDGTVQDLNINKDMLIFKDGEVINIKDVKPGDKVKLSLNQNDSYTKLKIISIQSNQKYISNIYKGVLSDITQDGVTLYNVKTLKKDKWLDLPERGFITINVDDSIKLYNNNKLINFDMANVSYQDKDVYLVSYKDYGQNEKVIMISCIDGFEKTYNDSIIGNSTSNKSLDLSNSFDKIGYGAGTIVTRYGRLITGNTIKINDASNIVALRDPVSQKYVATIVQIVEKPSISGVDIYRGRVASYKEGKSFTVDSFSLLKDTSWIFTNTPKTFDIDNDTVILNDQGIVDNRSFESYVNLEKVEDQKNYIYIVSSGTKAELISNAIYAINNIRGEIYSITGTTLSLKNMSVLNTTTGKWEIKNKGSISVLNNSIIIKDKKIVNAEDLTKGDIIRVIKKDNLETGNGIIILVEG